VSESVAAHIAKNAMYAPPAKLEKVMAAQGLIQAQKVS